MKADQIALQLYTVREQTAVDMLGTLDAVAEIGYRAVEFAGYNGIPTSEIRERLDTLGVRAISAHVSLHDVTTNPEAVIADLQNLGCSFAVVPWTPDEYRTSTASVRELAGLLNTAGKRIRDTGIRFGYHNHAFEFDPLDGSTMWDILAEATDPSLVDLQLDACWAYVAGFDVAEVIQRYGNRISMIHVKDRAASGDTDAPAGDGVLPWDSILAAAEAAGTQWYIVEQDNPQRAMSDIKRSFNNLVAMAK
jgi:sugar phosphate isomerase/epimerase